MTPAVQPSQQKYLVARFHIKSCTVHISNLCSIQGVKYSLEVRTEQSYTATASIENKYRQLFITSSKENFRTLACEQFKAATTPTTKQIQQQKCISGNDIIMHDAFSALEL